MPTEHKTDIPITPVPICLECGHELCVLPNHQGKKHCVAWACCDQCQLNDDDERDDVLDDFDDC
jgi:hypothetical protein